MSSCPRRSSRGSRLPRRLPPEARLVEPSPVAGLRASPLGGVGEIAHQSSIWICAAVRRCGPGPLSDPADRSIRHYYRRSERARHLQVGPSGGAPMAARRPAVPFWFGDLRPGASRGRSRSPCCATSGGSRCARSATRSPTTQAVALQPRRPSTVAQADLAGPLRLHLRLAGLRPAGARGDHRASSSTRPSPAPARRDRRSPRRARSGTADHRRRPAPRSSARRRRA